MLCWKLAVMMEKNRYGNVYVVEYQVEKLMILTVFMLIRSHDLISARNLHSGTVIMYLNVVSDNLYQKIV